MLPLQKLWQAIESVPGSAAVLPEWRDRLGDDLARVQSLLVPTDEFAATLRLPAAPYAEYRVVQHGPGDIVGVCDGDGSTVTLAKTDVLIYRLNQRRVLEEAASALGFDGTLEGVDGTPFTFRIGSWTPLAGFSFPAYATLPIEPTDFQRALDRVSTRSNGPFIFLAPTARFLNAACESVLQKHNASFLALNEAIEVGSNGKWSATSIAKQRLAEFQTAVIPSSTTSDGMVFFPTPPNATWADLRIKFIDGHTVTVTIGGETGTFVYSQLGMVDNRSGKPTVRWELLRSFAAGHGTLTWTSPAAKRENQKRCENLTKDLQRFFRIEGDPIEYVKSAKGWRTRFTVEPDA